MTRRIAPAIALSLMASACGSVDERDSLPKAAPKWSVIGSKMSLGRPVQRAGSSNRPQPLDTDKARYIVQLRGKPVSAYRGGVDSLQATAIQRSGQGRLLNVTRRGTLDAQSAISRAYVRYLDAEQLRMRNLAQSELGRTLQPMASYHYALNGFTARLSAREAAVLRALPGVRSVQKDSAERMTTASTPEFLGVPDIWSGAAVGGNGASGEGVLVGVIDSGINHSHPSFAERGGDGYVHTNPLGEGVGLGECRTRPGLCNNKLVGAYAFLDGQDTGTDINLQPGDPVSKDTMGHGSHVASILLGNVVNDVPIADAEGRDSGTALGAISGVAPHASLIAYKSCAAFCFASDTVRAIEQAIIDGVDVLSHSLTSRSASPWQEAKALAFLNARAAGIMVHSSAGNVGDPGSVSVGCNAPWVTSVAATTHDRGFTDKFLTDMSGGDTPAPPRLSGLSLSLGHSGPIVHAQAFDNGDDTPGQCNQPFPADTFNGEIVVCDAGSNRTRQLGCRNVRVGGAGGCVLASTDGGDPALGALPEGGPAIVLDVASGDRLRAWLSSGAGHAATITGSSEATRDPERADVMDVNASAGPFFDLDLLVPTLTAPGVSILGAGAGVFGLPQQDAPALGGQFGILSGSSMAAPHVAGASALLRQLHPDWTPAEVRSALMTTAADGVRTPVGTLATAFDRGGGRLQIRDAAAAGLLLDETAANFLRADPALGGDPSQLNLPGLVQDLCPGQCRWQRTLRATVDGTWTADSSGQVRLDVEPSTFTLAAGESVALTISASTAGLQASAFSFGRVTLTADSPSIPTTTLTAAVRPRLASEPGVFTKSVSKAAAASGDTVSYSLNVVSPAQGSSLAAVDDTLPAGVSPLEGSLGVELTNAVTTSPWVNRAGGLSWTGILGAASGQLEETDAPIEGFLSLAALGIAPLACSGITCDEGAIVIGGLEIQYFGRTFTSAAVSANGTLELGALSATQATSFRTERLPTASLPNTLLAPFWTDLHLARDGNAYYAALSPDGGTTLFDVVSWENVPLFRRPSGTDPRYNFQIWSQRGTDNIWFVYGDLGPLPADLSVGIEGPEGRAGASYHFEGVGAAPTTGVDLQLNTVNAGSATLSFQAQLIGAVGETVVNTATLTLPGSQHFASALTVLDQGRPVDDGGVGDANR